MATPKLLHCVGLSEEEIAHLRLMLRVARKQLRDEWAWGPEPRADLIIVNARRLIGESARRRALQREVACAQILEPGDLKPAAGQFLRRPFRRDAVVLLLNSVGQEGGALPEGDSWSDESLDFDLGMVDLSVLEADHPGVRDVHAHRHEANAVSAISTAAIPDLSQLLVADPPEEAADADVLADAAASISASEIEAALPIDENATYPLLDYLQENLLRGPSRIVLPGVAVLMVDPAEMVYLAQGSLSALEPYARRPLRYGDWQPLGRADKEAMRMSSFTRPFTGLIWMIRFIHSNGFLTKSFDPAGQFRLINRLNLAQDYPRAFRVGAQLNVQRRLHEVARLSSVDIDEVCNVINAYEAIGYVEATRR